MNLVFSRIIESIYVYSNMSSDLSLVRSCTSFWVRRNNIFAVYPQSVQGLNTLNIQLIADHNFGGICCFARKPGIAVVFCSLPGFITWRHRSLLRFLRAQLYSLYLIAGLVCFRSILCSSALGWQGDIRTAIPLQVIGDFIQSLALPQAHDMLGV